jgi:hypothetical protein
MEILAWLWWVISTVLGAALSIVWFLVSGWVSALLQIALLVIVIYFLKYGWQRAPAELWRRTRSFAGFFLGWIRAREASPLARDETIRIVKSKEFGDINISTLLSLLMLAGLVLASRLEGLAR